MQDTYLITISGPNHAGLISKYATLLATAHATLLDIGQAVIHNSLTIGLMIAAEGDALNALMGALQAEARSAGATANIQAISDEGYREWVDGAKQGRLIFTLLGAPITAKQLASVTQLFDEHRLTITQMDRLSDRSAAASVDNPRMCIEIAASGSQVDTKALRQALLELAGDENFDIAVQEDSIYRRSRRLVVFDMDSTLIQMEVIDELARRAGVYDEVSAITASAMRGEIDFPTSFRQRMALLKGMSADALDDVANHLPLMPGIERLMRTLKTLGYKTGIISGGFTHFAKRLQADLGFDYVYAHELEIFDGHLTGEITGEVIDGNRKAEILREIAAREGIALAQTIAVGDGANDLPMLSVAGIGVAFHAKPLVRQKAEHSISLMGLDALLYLLGIRDRHVEN